MSAFRHVLAEISPESPPPPQPTAHGFCPSTQEESLYHIVPNALSTRLRSALYRRCVLYFMKHFLQPRSTKSGLRDKLTGLFQPAKTPRWIITSVPVPKANGLAAFSPIGSADIETVDHIFKSCFCFRLGIASRILSPFLLAVSVLARAVIDDQQVARLPSWP